MDTEIDHLARRVGRTIQAARTAQGRSLGDVSRASGLSKTIVSRIESGDGNPSMETLWRLSRALGLPIGALLTEEEQPRTRVIRAGTAQELRAEDGMEASLLHSGRAEHRTELFELRFERGIEHRSEAHLPGTEEVLVCHAGALLAGPLGEEEELHAGDTLWFTADVPHRYLARRAARATNLILYVRAAAP